MLALILIGHGLILDPATGEGRPGAIFARIYVEVPHVAYVTPTAAKKVRLPTRTPSARVRERSRAALRVASESSPQR